YELRSELEAKHHLDGAGSGLLAKAHGLALRDRPEVARTHVHVRDILIQDIEQVGELRLVADSDTLAELKCFAGRRGEGRSPRALENADSTGPGESAIAGGDHECRRVEIVLRGGV